MPVLQKIMFAIINYWGITFFEKSLTIGQSDDKKILPNKK